MIKTFFFSLLFLISSVAFATCTDSLLFHKHGIVKVRESSFAVYYSRPADSILVYKLDSFMTTKVESLFEKFKHRINGKVQFELYPSLKDAQCICGWDTLQVPWEMLGCAHEVKKVQMALFNSSAKADSIYEIWGGFYRVMLHEYIHTITCDIVGKERNDKMPRWIMEGVACIGAKQLLFNKMFKGIIEKKLENKEVPTVQDLQSLKKFYKLPSNYHWSFLFCKYIIDSYGWDKLLAIQEHYEDFNKIMGRTNKEINAEWLTYLRNKQPEE